MEFYEFFEKTVSFIPSDFEHFKNICELILPWLFGLLTITTSFAGHLCIMCGIYFSFSV